MSNKKKTDAFGAPDSLFFILFMVSVFGIYERVFCPWSHGILDSNIAFDLQRSNYQTV
jgi:hypothetical protein